VCLYIPVIPSLIPTNYCVLGEGGIHGELLAKMLRNVLIKHSDCTTAKRLLLKGGERLQNMWGERGSGIAMLIRDREKGGRSYAQRERESKRDDR
jgi:hypothetical protein